METIVEQWNDAAARYTQEQEASEFVEGNKHVVQTRFDHFDGEKLLDLGCGYGFFTDYFRTVGADAIGVDGSTKMIEIARDRYPAAAFAVMDITKPLAFADDTFDVVFCNQVLMDIEDVAFVFSECNRILKTGGILYYAIVHPAFYDCHWLQDENGYRYAKTMDRYISPYSLTQAFWGKTQHFHRSLSYYLNTAASNGFILKETWEPVSYDGVHKNSDLPLFFFAEYVKAGRDDRCMLNQKFHR